MRRAITWAGPVPARCDTCPAELTDTFYDMRTTSGPWGCLCPSCAMLGPGIGRLGTGLGQKYERQADGSWLKTEG